MTRSIREDPGASGFPPFPSVHNPLWQASGCCSLPEFSACGMTAARWPWEPRQPGPGHDSRNLSIRQTRLMSRFYVSLNNGQVYFHCFPKNVVTVTFVEKASRLLNRRVVVTTTGLL